MGVKLTPPPDFFGFNFCYLSVYPKASGTTVLCSLPHVLTIILIKSDVTIDDIIIIRHATCVLTTKVQNFTKK